MQTVALVIDADAGPEIARTELEVHGLWAGYGAGDVLQDYELIVRSGETVRLTGRNGSGKSTLLNCIAGSHKPRAGSILIGGISLMDRAVEAKRLIGMSSGTCPFPYLTGREHLELARRVYDLSAGHVANFLERFSAWESVRALDQEVRTYSHGMRQQLALLLATVHEPALLLLDEATDGLDKESQADWSRYLNERSEAAGTLIYVAHKDGVADGFPEGRSVRLSRGQ